MKNPDFGFLTDIKNAMGRNKGNDKELARLQECWDDVRSRMTDEEFVSYEKSLVLSEFEQQKEDKRRAAELAEMDLQRDSNSI
jgi:hypothetical protein